jgi:2-methylisocitrate lyase-like PEP mutase family enzyme
MLIGGATPILSAEELGRMGFKICVSPVESLAITAFAVRELAAAMRDHGRVDGLAERMLSFGELKDVLGVGAWLK